MIIAKLNNLAIFVRIDLTTMKKFGAYLYIVVISFILAPPCEAGIPDFAPNISNNKVNVITQDSEGYIWFGTNSGLNKFTGENFLVWKASIDALNSGVIHDFCFTPNGDLWMATECGLERRRGNEIYNPEYAIINPMHRVLSLKDGNIIVSGRDGIQKIQLYEDPYKVPPVTNTFFTPGLGWAKNIVLDSRENVWIAAEIEGTSILYVLDNGLNLLKEEIIGRNNPIIAINYNPDNTVWIATKAGLYCYDADSRDRTTAGKNARDLFSEGNCLFMKTYDENTLLIAHRDEVMHLYSLTDDSVSHIHEDEKLTSERYICFVDRDKNIWLSYPEVGYKVFPVEKGYTSHYQFMKQLGSETLRNMRSDSRGRIWMSLDNGYAGYDPITRKILWKDISKKSFTHLFVDSRDKLYTVKNLSNLNIYNLKGDTPVLERIIKFNSNISSLSEDADGNIWIVNNSTFHIINMDGQVIDMGPIRDDNGNIISHTVSLADPRYKQVFVNTFDKGIYVCDARRGFSPLEIGRLSSINSVVTASDGTTWLGSLHEGLIHYFPINAHFRRYDITNGLPGNSIMAVIEDFNGKIWFNTTTHIVCYDPATNRLNSIYDNHFNESDYYSPRCVTRTADGKIFFGGYGGITEIDHNTIFDRESHEIPLRTEYITIDGQPVAADKIEMKYTQNLLTIVYSGLNLNFGSMVNFSYIMDGLDKEWTATDDVRISYTNLKPGKYTFRVRARLMNGEWSRDEISIPVIVRPAPWASLPAKIAYVIMAILLVVIFTRRHLRQQLREKDIKMKQEHLDFITNISHELRTPLSLIVAPLKQLQQSENLSEKEKGLIEMMERNAQRLSVISEDIMDTPSAYSKDTALHVSQMNISDFITGISNSFLHAAMDKEQTILTEIPDGLCGWIDRPKIEKILYNLISNACKYAGEGRNIRISLKENSGFADITVSDNGIGISKDKQDKIFERHNRLGAELKSVKGSGIGLNYSLELAHIHKGDLTYSQENGTGSIFTLSIPCVREAYEESEILNESAASKYQTSGNNLSSVKYTPGKPNILIAEDSEDIRIFLNSLLGDDFNLSMAHDGQEAWDNLKTAVPDLVISDIMMPHKDGISLCKDIKKHAEYCHIPVILLTAKTGKDDNIKGLEIGADSYVNKPFDPDILIARVNNLIENRKRIQMKVLSLTSTTMQDEETVKNTSLKEHEIEFINKMHKVIEEHMDDEQFSVEALAKEIGVSYSKLYAKVKALTGQTPLVFLSTYKMNRAMELLKSGKYTVAEVSDMVGASSPFNFSRDFKKHFNVTPSSVAKS